MENTDIDIQIAKLDRMLAERRRKRDFEYMLERLNKMDAECRERIKVVNEYLNR